MILTDKKREEEKLVGVISSLAASTEKDVGNVELEGGRTVAITCRVTYNAAATSGVTCKLYFVSEKTGQDTVPFASFVPTLTAGAIVQRTVLVDAPEGSNFVVKVKNDDGTFAATEIQVGSSIMRW